MKIASFEKDRKSSYGVVTDDGIIDMGPRIGAEYPALIDILKADAFANKEPDEKRIWFYSSKTHVAKCLHELEEIRKGKGIHPGGSRCYFKHARKNNDEYK